MDPPSYVKPHQTFVGQAALRSGDWKLIVGQPNCGPAWNSINCPTGWVHLNGTIDQPPDTPYEIWLFNVTADPNEKNNMAVTFQDIVALMKEKIDTYNSTHVVQMDPPFDPTADPKNFGGVWTPWLD